MRHILWLLSVAVVTWILATAAPAQAQAPTVSNCSSGQAPSGYDTLSCGGRCVVTGAGSDFLVCDTDESAGSGDTEAWIVTDYPISSTTTYSAWGTDENGVDFCCFIDDTGWGSINTVVLTGTPQADDFSFQSGARQLSASTHIMATGADDDILTGSDASTPDLLDGEAGADLIFGEDGDDVLEGGTQGDTIYGGDDNDEIFGEGGQDELFGESGNDEISGGDHKDICEGGDGDDFIQGGLEKDWLRGNGGNDTIHGDAGEDVICGGATTGVGQDSLYANTPTLSESPNEVDLLWEPALSNTPTGSAQSGDSCGDNGTHTGWAGSCSDSLSTRPAGCYAAGPPV